MRTLGEVLPGLHPEVRRWLDSRGVPADGPPFCRYNVIDMDRQLEVEAGFPVAAPLPGDDQVLAAALPAGRYATLWPTGHPDGLVGATRALLDWAVGQGLTSGSATAADDRRRTYPHIPDTIPGWRRDHEGFVAVWRVFSS